MQSSYLASFTNNLVLIMKLLNHKKYILYIFPIILVFLSITVISSNTLKKLFVSCTNDTILILSEKFNFNAFNLLNYVTQYERKKIDLRKNFEVNSKIKISKKINSEIVTGKHIINSSLFDLSFLSLSDKHNTSKTLAKFVNSQNPYIENLTPNDMILHYSIGKFALFNKNERIVTKVKSNLCILINNKFDLKCDDSSNLGVTDIYFNSGQLFVSAYIRFNRISEIKKNNCYGLILFSSLPFDNLYKEEIKFNLVYNTPSCIENANTSSAGGRIQKDDTGNIFMTIGDFQPSHTEVKEGESYKYKTNHVSQNNNTHFGKIITLDTDFNPTIYSKGHRNPQGLMLFDNFLLETEHGPNGGDEINQIKEGNNYGYPFASYGFPYNLDYEMEKEHNLPFVSPILYFSPSIGISEIIYYDHDEFFRWKNKLILSSLYENSLFIIDAVLDQKVIVKNIEKIDLSNLILEESNIPIDFRIRDLKIDNEGKIWIISDDSFLMLIEKSSSDY